MNKCVEECGAPAFGHEWPLNVCNVCFYVNEVLEAAGCSNLPALYQQHEAKRQHRECVLARLSDVVLRCGVEDGPRLVAEVERLTR